MDHQSPSPTQEEPFAQANGAAHSIAETLREQWNVVSTEINDSVHERPWPAVGIAFTAGLLFGLIVYRD